jgi:hypothetical protein
MTCRCPNPPVCRSEASTPPVDGDKITSINVFPKDTKALHELTDASVTPPP